MPFTALSFRENKVCKPLPGPCWPFPIVVTYKNADVWPLAYLQWEKQILSELGFALDLTSCAVTGSTDELCYVSPKTGRAVSAEGAGEWADRLLPLPPVLAGTGDATDDDIVQALDVTGHFLEHKVLKGLGDVQMPAARLRLIDAIRRG